MRPGTGKNPAHPVDPVERIIFKKNPFRYEIRNT
jgi:hypothetical protein